MKRLKSRVSKFGIDALLVSDPYNIRYLAGFYSEGAMILVPRKGKVLYFIDTMNLQLVKRMLKGRPLEIIAEPGPAGDTLARHIKKEKMKKVGINAGNMPLAAYQRLSRILPKVKFIQRSGGVDLSGILKGMREVKSPEEVRILKEAARKTVRIWNKVKARIKIGMTEKEIASMVDTCVLGEGCTVSFPTIAAIGPNTAYPHAVPTARRLKRNEHVLVDFGIKHKGYCSDLTRTWDNGRIDRQIRDFRDSVHKAHDEAIKMIKPGALIEGVASKAYNILTIKDGGKFILHGLGHGVGLEVHERPFLRRASKERFKKGMVVTVEPGLYKPGLGGIRLEDMVLVTEKGQEVLTV